MKLGRITPITHPAPRWAAYAFALRAEGLDIETITETHGGAFSGHHARYVLNTIVRVVDERQAT